MSLWLVPAVVVGAFVLPIVLAMLEPERPAASRPPSLRHGPARSPRRGG